MGQRGWVGLGWVCSSIIGSTEVFICLPTTRELARECYVAGISRDPRESTLKRTGPHGPGLLIGTPSLLPHSVGHTKFICPNPKSRGKKCRHRLERRLETITQVTTYNIRSGNIKGYEKT